MNLPAQHKSPILTPMSRQFIRFCVIGGHDMVAKVAVKGTWTFCYAL